MFSTMAANVLVTQGASASAAMILTLLSQNIMVSAPKLSNAPIPLGYDLFPTMPTSVDLGTYARAATIGNNRQKCVVLFILIML